MLEWSTNRYANGEPGKIRLKSASHVFALKIKWSMEKRPTKNETKQKKEEDEIRVTGFRFRVVSLSTCFL